MQAGLDARGVFGSRYPFQLGEILREGPESPSDFSNGKANMQNGDFFNANGGSLHFDNVLPPRGGTTNIMTMDTSSPQDAQVTAEMRKIYLQDPTPLSQRPDTSNLWEWPQPDPTLLAAHKDCKLPRKFNEICRLITKHWGIEARDAIPGDLRPYTPYSMALLLAIRRLASHTKQDCHAGQRRLMAAWRARVGEPSGLPFHANGMQIMHTNVELGMGAEECEKFIQETNYGLTLDDVLAAGKGRQYRRPEVKAPSGKVRGKAGKRARDLPGMGVMSLGEERAARRATKNENREAHQKAMENRQEQNDALGSGSKITKRSKAVMKAQKRAWGRFDGEKGSKLLRFLQDEDDGGVMLPSDDAANEATAPPNSPELGGVPLQPAVDSMLADQPKPKPKTKTKSLLSPSDDPDYAEPRTKQDRHNDGLLSNMFNKVDVASNKNINAKRERKFLDVAAKKGSLPTDRVKLAEIPTLYAQQQRVGAKEAEKGEQEAVGVDAVRTAMGRVVIVDADEDEEL